MNSEDMMVSVKRADLEDWGIAAAQGEFPQVAYSDDPMEMLRQAYVERGNLLEIIRHGINRYTAKGANQAL